MGEAFGVRAPGSGLGSWAWVARPRRALGYPIGGTGAIFTMTARYGPRRADGRYALVTMGIGGGQGIAATFERC